jgi:DNA-binding transcriptional ArsR family regulator
MNMEDEIVISRKDFKALSSETRTGVLKLLKDRNYTLTELAHKLNLAAPTIKQHLSVLQEADLIEEIDDGRKWKYYRLTRRGKKVLGDETPKHFVILLGITSIVLVALLFSSLINPLEQIQIFNAPALAANDSTSRELENTDTPTAGIDTPTSGSIAQDTIEKEKESIPIQKSQAPDTSRGLFVIIIALAALLEGYLIARVVR